MIHGSVLLSCLCSLLDVLLILFPIFLYVRGPREVAKEEQSTTTVSSVSKTYIEPSAIALYDYEPTAADDLSFNVSEWIYKLIYVLVRWGYVYGGLRIGNRSHSWRRLTSKIFQQN